MSKFVYYRYKIGDIIKDELDDKHLLLEAYKELNNQMWYRFRILELNEHVEYTVTYMNNSHQHRKLA